MRLFILFAFLSASLPCFAAKGFVVKVVISNSECEFRLSKEPSSEDYQVTASGMPGATKTRLILEPLFLFDRIPFRNGKAGELAPRGLQNLADELLLYEDIQTLLAEGQAAGDRNLINVNEVLLGNKPGRAFWLEYLLLQPGSLTMMQGQHLEIVIPDVNRHEGVLFVRNLSELTHSYLEKRVYYVRITETED